MMYSVLFSVIMPVIDVISLVIMIHSLDLQKEELNLMKASMADSKVKENNNRSNSAR